MNLALQKRHEQLERWRQNEAVVELIEKQQALDKNDNNNNTKSKKHDYPKQNKTVQTHLNISSASAITSPTSRFLSNNFDNTDNNNSLSSSNDDNKNYNNSNKNKNCKIKKGKQLANLQVKFTNSTLFLTACANGDLDDCKRLLDKNLVDINVTTCDGLTGLHEAAICGNSEMVEYLINRGANINCLDNEGWTPLHAAASLGQAEIVEILLNYGADVQRVNCENFLAYDLARNDQVRVLIGEKLNGIDIDYLHSQEERLIENDIDSWIRTGKYEERSHPVTNATVLHVIAAKGYVKLLKKILEIPKLKKQMNFEARDTEGYTPLLAASFWNQAEIVELLIEHGANIFAQANNGYKISSVHLKNYQQSKLQHQQQSSSDTSRNRASVQSVDSDANYTKSRSTTSLDSSATDTSFDEQSGDNIPSGSARHLKSQGQLLKSQSLDISRQQQTENDPETPLLSSSMSVDRLLLRMESMGEKDLRKSFKELVMENERLKRQLSSIDERDKQKQQDWIRIERQLQRKISELEEENKQLEQWRLEIQRLKDENSSLIRVVSKLSKQH